MLRIGVAGNSGIYKTSEILYRIYAIKGAGQEGEAHGLLPEIHMFCFELSDEIPCLVNDSEFDILIINSHCKGMYDNLTSKYNLPLSKVIIINSDEREIMNYLPNNATQKLITYGINNKACVTASSMAEGACTICIQRAFASLSGRQLVQQEFTINSLKGIRSKEEEARESELENKTYSLLAAVTCALISDIPIDIIEKLY